MTDVAAQTTPESVPPRTTSAPSPIWQRPIGWIIAGAAFVVVVLVVVVIVVAAQPHAFTVKGSLLVSDATSVSVSGNSCSTSGGYGDIATGASVVITDAAGKTIAIGNLKSGKALDATDCAFFFTVNDVPDGLKFYGVEISHRGNVKYSLDEMRKGPVLSLGGN